MRHQFFSGLLYTWLLCLFFVSAVDGQNMESDFPWYMNTGVENCEMSLISQELIAMEARKSPDKKKILIVIVRPGTGEISAEVSRRRISRIEQFFLTGRGMLAAEQFVVAAGPKVVGLGRYEFYLDGKLAQVLFMRRNKYLCHSCCGPEEAYPEKVTNRKRTNQKK
ncbi:MAG: hypothetical protein ABL959_20720 [Pyrinomonadaceae bacterium]